MFKSHICINPTIHHALTLRTLTKNLKLTFTTVTKLNCTSFSWLPVVHFFIDSLLVLFNYEENIANLNCPNFFYLHPQVMVFVHSLPTRPELIPVSVGWSEQKSFIFPIFSPEFLESFNTTPSITKVGWCETNWRKIAQIGHTCEHIWLVRSVWRKKGNSKREGGLTPMEFWGQRGVTHFGIFEGKGG